MAHNLLLSFSVSITSTVYYVVTGTVYQLNDLSNRSSTTPPGPTGLCLFPRPADIFLFFFFLLIIIKIQ